MKKVSLRKVAFLVIAFCTVCWVLAAQVIFMVWSTANGPTNQAADFHPRNARDGVIYVSANNGGMVVDFFENMRASLDAGLRVVVTSDCNSACTQIASFRDEILSGQIDIDRAYLRFHQCELGGEKYDSCTREMWDRFDGALEALGIPSAEEIGEGYHGIMGRRLREYYQQQALLAMAETSDD